ncbi:DUF2501 domain-containing protein [Dyella caseinilytica]|uniref:DUF2501 domain-containing protein n=1 Tax=Dyella caseinilytica TaxID=1849581 RepID=A0ABX7GY98_9GAMM|nr:DUF2501 domain-containing protein [Dyella caseinilytica]QRN55480.1 DUF2501 domain-containing protein [Dyella caseinilytica]GGA02068.1 hypothetical protein GCM10011408_24320 [Dyella caseinilytica]
MKTRIGGIATACAAAMILGFAGSAASAQDLGSLGGKLGGSSLGNMLPGGGTSGSTGNVAGILQYCVKNNYLGGDSGASGIAGKLLGKTQGGGSNSDYQNGASGILQGKDGQKTDLNSIGGGNSDMKSKLTTKACGVVLNQGKSLVGGGSSSGSKLGGLLGH